MSRICRETQMQLPALVGGTLGAGRRRLVASHLRRCEDCQREHVRQQAVAAGLDQLETTADAEPPVPPEGLLESLLEQAHQPGVRGRAAVPARGALSGSRPGLSVVFLLFGAAAGTAAGYAGWRGARAIKRSMDQTRRIMKRGRPGAGRGRGHGSGRRGAGR